MKKPMGKMAAFEKKDAAADKRAGIKENSTVDKRQDAKGLKKAFVPGGKMGGKAR